MTEQERQAKIQALQAQINALQQVQVAAQPPLPQQAAAPAQTASQRMTVPQQAPGAAGMLGAAYGNQAAQQAAQFQAFQPR